MRTINKVIIHCAGTKTNQNFDVSNIDQWHRDRGWSEIGYHYYIKLDGTIQQGRDLKRVGAHCAGYNSSSVGVCLEGGKNPDGSKWDMCTRRQEYSVEKLLKKLGKQFPEITLHGHYEFSKTKSCPNFDINKFYFR